MLRYFWPTDDEQLAGQWTDSHFDEDASWWVGVQQAGATLALAAVLTATAASTSVAQGVFSQHQDDPAGSLSTQALVGEDYWNNPVPPVVWPQPFVFLDDDAHPVFVSVFTPDDGDWRPLVSSVPDSLTLRLPFLDPEDYPTLPSSNNPVDDSAVWAPNNSPWDLNWNLLFFLDDGSAVPVFQYDEDFWTPRLAPQNWLQPQQPFLADDDLIPQVPAEDPVWLQLVAPFQATLLSPQQWTFDQNEQSANLVAFVDEFGWVNPVAPVPAGNGLLQQWIFEQEDSGALTALAFEEYWQNGVAAVADGLRLQQQWAFEQHDPGGLRAFHDEDFWVSGVAPVVWPQPSVFTSDELVVPQSLATIDELLNSQFVSPWVAAIPAAMYVGLPYSPDPEEIPAGNLEPFVPPPPPAPCLPPAGPDGDVHYSYFGGLHPTAVLLCRICNSGRPLLIRGDYAIWCQDCCAFVTKSDTYMGTVRAPGRFKGVF